MTDAAIKTFVEERPGMAFLGLLATGAGFSDFLSGEGSLKVQLREQMHDACITQGFSKPPIGEAQSLRYMYDV